MNINELHEQVIPAALEAIKVAPVEGETDTKSPIRVAVFESLGERFTIREQNTKKSDKSGMLTKYAKLALSGHTVSWIVREKTNDWFLVVDGEHTAKEAVTPNGGLSI